MFERLSAPFRSSRRIRQQLLFGNLVIALLLLLAMAILVNQVQRLGQASQILEVSNARAQAAFEIEQSSSMLTENINRLVAVEDASAFEQEVNTALEELRPRSDELAVLASEASETDPVYGLLTQVSESIKSVIGVAETMVRQASAEQWPAVEIRLGILLRDQEELTADTTALVSLTESTQAEASINLASAQRAALVYPSLMAVAAIVIGIIFNWRIAVNFSGEIEAITESVSRLAGGDLEARVESSRADEFGQLGNAFNSMATVIQTTRGELEDRVLERTQELERRALQLRVASEIARDASAIHDLLDLLNRSVALISERFGFYHAGIFLVDDEGENAWLRAVSSEGGRRMLARNHHLAVGKVGIVGYVTGTGKPRIALDVGEDLVHFANPDLPETRSEMALPLRVGSRIIGALDVQSEEPNAFREDDIVVLQTVADQLAVAIDNASLFERQSTLATQRNEVIDLYNQLQQQTQYDRLRMDTPEMLRLSLGFKQVVLALVESDQVVIQSVAGDHFPEYQPGVMFSLGQGLIGQAVSLNKAVISPEQKEGEAETARLAEAAIPLLVRGQAIGSLLIVIPSGRDAQAEGVSVLDLVADQIATALENARLFEETERRLRDFDTLYKRQTADTWGQLLASLPSEDARTRATYAKGVTQSEGAVLESIERPIELRGQVIGKMNIQADKLNDWSEDAQEILESVAMEVAGSLEQLRLMEEIQRRATQLEAAAAIARDATSLLDIETLVSRAVTSIRDRFGYEHIGVYLLDSSGKTALLREATGSSGQQMVANGHFLAVGSPSVIGRVTATGQCYAANDTATDEFFQPEPLLPNTRSQLGVPLKIGERVIGALDIHHTHPQAFTAEDISVLEILGDQLAVAIQNAELFQQTLRRAQREQAVLAITSKIRSSDDIETMLQIAIRELRKTLGARRGRIRLADRLRDPTMPAPTLSQFTDEEAGNPGTEGLPIQESGER
ncbi:MAG: GAF domain-containing protein [Anaerolineales bacterium]|nr:GAF domain-containing protein [Anaerolineales bacterium]